MKQNMAMLKQMAAVTEAQYLTEHAKIKPLLDHEARLRGRIAKLEDQVQAARTDMDQDHAMKALGADIIWQGWHLRMRRTLNMELAQVTAKKLQGMERLRKSFGRKTAVSDMAATERARLKAARAKVLMDRLLQP